MTRTKTQPPLLRWMLTALLAVSPLSLVSVMAQDEPEYRMEIGGGVGLTGYVGDFNSALLKEMQPAGALVARYKPNPRMAWTATMGVGKLKASSADTGTWYPAPGGAPDEPLPPYEFSHQVVDFGVRYEYNFWAYGTGQEYRGARRLSPFVATGVGLTLADAQGTELAGNMALAAGVKYKIGNRLNLTAEWSMHFTTSDKLDGVADPYGIKSSGIFKNTDCYNTLQLSLTYDIWAKCKTCNNDRD